MSRWTETYHVGANLDQHAPLRIELTATAGGSRKTSELGTHGRSLRATYDAAQTSDENSAHWSGADIADADRANSPAVRSRLRIRSRYEFANNPTYCGAILLTANYEVGSLEDSPGPTLEITDSNVDGQAIATAWNEWATAINFGLKLHTSVQARVRDGEVFGFLGTDPALPVDVKLNWRPFEADQCQTPYLPYNSPNRIDGIWFDDWDRPTFYDVLRHHPGGIIPDPWLVDTIPAQFITHLYRQDRPRQHRGIPEMVSSIDLWADRRRLRKATVAANEAAANISLAVQTEAPAGEADEIQPGAVEIPRNSMFAIPYGASVSQVAADHPNGTYEMFDDATCNEAGRCLTMPFNVLACNSGKTNMSAGRLDQGMWFTSLGFNQVNNRVRVVDPVFCEWYAEARLLHGWPEKIPARVWHWPGQPYSDPIVDANADKIELGIGTKSMQEIWARKGANWRIRMTEAAAALGRTVSATDRKSVV
jgi:capsid protein